MEYTLTETVNHIPLPRRAIRFLFYHKLYEVIGEVLEYYRVKFQCVLITLRVPSDYTCFQVHGVGSLAEVATGGPLQMPLRRCF